MGKKHAERYRDLSDAKLVAVVDINLERAKNVAQLCQCNHYASVGQLLDYHPNLQAASIAVPTRQHEQVSEILIQKGVACLIEKPLASTAKAAKRIVALAKQHNVVIQVGHVERFNPAINAVRRLKPEPLLIKSERVSRMPFRSLDVDVILDLMIHDLDLALLFTGDDVHGSRVEARGVSLENQPAHIATASIVFPRGCVVDLNASRIAFGSKREIRLFSSDSYISIDCQEKRATLVREADYVNGLKLAREMYERGEHISDQCFREIVRAQDLVTPSEAALDALTLELKEFLAVVRREIVPEIGIEAGVNAVALAEHVSEAMNRGRLQLQ